MTQKIFTPVAREAEVLKASTRYYAMTLNDSGVNTDEHLCDEARQQWFDKQDASQDDFYFLDISTTGELLDAGLAFTGDGRE